MVAGATLIKGMNIGDPIHTPMQPIFNSETVTPESYQTLIDVAKEFGYPVSYIQEQGGALVHNLLPVHKTETQQISTSSKVELELHTELAFHPYRPNYVLLLCLRGDNKAMTTFSDGNNFINYLNNDVIYTLSQQLYVTTLDQSFISSESADVQINLSILEPADFGDFPWKIRFDWALMRGINDRAQSALAELRKAISLFVKKVSLEAGDLLIINNDTTVHGRLPFQPRYDGSDRWVQRLLVRRTLPPVSEMSGRFVISTKFT